MSFTRIAPEVLTLADIAKWNGEEMKYQLAQSGMREAVTRVLQAKSQADVEAAQAKAQVEAQAQAEREAYRLGQDLPPIAPVKTAEEIAAEQAEANRVAAEAEVARVAALPKKFVIEYQVKDEDGVTPIGRPTHLEATSQEELIEKMKEAHIQATRAFHRLKKQKVTFKPEVKAPAPVGLTDAELTQAVHELRSEDPKVVVAAQQKINKSEMDKQLAPERAKLAAEQEDARKTNIVLAWLRSHVHDYNPCEANGNLVEEFMNEHNLEVTVDNLDLALVNLGSKLVEVIRPEAPVVKVVPPAAVVPQAQPTVQAAVPPQVNPAPVVPKPGVNGGGIVPGQNSGVRPSVQPAGLTIADIRSWDGKTMAAKMKNPSQRAEIERVLTAHNARRAAQPR